MVSLTNKLLLTLQFILLPFLLAAQQILDFSHQLSGDKIEITYALGGKASDRYEVRLYCSFDDYKTPLTLVEGEIGKNIMPGKDKKVVWEAKTEIGEYEGNLALKLKARLIPFMIFSVQKGAKLKRGKANIIRWATDNSGQQITLELYRNHQKVSGISAIESGNSYNWEIPKDLKPGRDFKIKGNDGKRTAFSAPFSIKRKVPLIIWVLPAVVAGGVVALLVSGGNNEGPIPLPVKPN